MLPPYQFPHNERVRTMYGPLSKNRLHIHVHSSYLHQSLLSQSGDPAALTADQCGMDVQQSQPYTFRKASFCSRCLLIIGVTWSVSELGPSLSAPPHQSSSLLYSCSRLSRTLQTWGKKAPGSEITPHLPSPQHSREQCHPCSGDGEGGRPKHRGLPRLHVAQTEISG